MTVIAGFQCPDALLMCADSEQTISKDSKSQARKIEIFSVGDVTVAVGGAGDADLIQYVQHQLRQRFRHSPLGRLENADVWMQSFARDMWNECIRPYRGFAVDLVPDASFLIGLQMTDDHRLYRWERNTAWLIPKGIPVSIGIGVIQSEPLLAELQNFDPYAHQLLLFAVRAMLRVKQLVQGCGGKTEVVLLCDDRRLIIPETVQIDAIEHLIEQMDEYLLWHGVGFVAGYSTIGKEQVDIEDLTELLEMVKAEYEKIVADLFSWDRPSQD